MNTAVSMIFLIQWLICFNNNWCVYTKFAVCFFKYDTSLKYLFINYVLARIDAQRYSICYFGNLQHVHWGALLHQGIKTTVWAPRGGKWKSWSAKRSVFVSSLQDNSTILLSNTNLHLEKETALSVLRQIKSKCHYRKGRKKNSATYTGEMFHVDSRILYHFREE